MESLKLTPKQIVEQEALPLLKDLGKTEAVSSIKELNELINVDNYMQSLEVRMMQAALAGIALCDSEEAMMKHLKENKTEAIKLFQRVLKVSYILKQFVVHAKKELESERR